MPNYQNGKIYCIRSFKTDDIYIGSTTQPLCKRIDGHRQDYRKWIYGKRKYISSFELIKHGDAYIELIASYPCNDKEELNKEEGKYQREMECVNKCIAGRTQKERYEDNTENVKQKAKEYYNNNSDKIKDYQKKYRKENVEKLKEYENNRPNKEERAQKQKEYYYKNKQRVLQRVKQKITCICGSTICKGDIRKHERSQKHIQFIQSQN